MFWLFGNFVRGYGVDGLEKKGLGGAQVRVVVYGERLVVGALWGLMRRKGMQESWL